MNDLRYFVQMEEQGFKLNYRGRTGLIYVSCLRRWEGSLPSFTHYIKPEHAIWEEWETGEGPNWVRKPFILEDRVVGFFARQGQYSRLIYKTFFGNLVGGLHEMEAQAMTITQVAKLGKKG